jgi:hypothetical protein
MPSQIPTVIDSTSLFDKMKTVNTTTNRLNRPRTLHIQLIAAWKWIGENITAPLRDKELKIFACTWNLLGKLPSPAEVKILLNTSIAHDVYVIVTEECQRSIAASFWVTSKTLWEDVLQSVLGSKFQKLCSDTLMATHIIIFVNNQLLSIIKSNVGSYMDCRYRGGSCSYRNR